MQQYNECIFCLSERSDCPIQLNGICCKFAYHPKCYLDYCQIHLFTDITCPCCRKSLSDSDLDQIGQNNAVSPMFAISSIRLQEELDKGKHIYYWNSKGVTFLHLCCGGFADPKNLEIISNMDFNVNSLTKDGESVLALALAGLQFDIAKNLASNVNIKNIGISKKHPNIKNCYELALHYFFRFLSDDDTWRTNQIVEIIKLLRDKEGFKVCTMFDEMFDDES